MTSSNGRAFNDWLRSQLKVKKMSQRQLAQQSGVDHSTISRLIRGDRMPSLGTATKLARGLRELRDEDDGPQYLRLVGAPSQNPTARVEYALRADDVLSEAHVRQVMEYYLAIRRRRMQRTVPAMAHSNGHAASVGDPAVAPSNGHATVNGANGRATGHAPAGHPSNRQEALERRPPVTAHGPFARSGNEAPVAVATRVQASRPQANRSQPNRPR
jgi:transcriptional regulator with XRE-family HTH domain